MTRIHLPLEAHSGIGAPTLEAHVELEEEAGMTVRLSLDLHPQEFIGRTPDREDLVDDDRQAYAEGDEVGPLRDEVRRLQTLLEREQGYTARLFEVIGRVKDQRDLWRELLPEEARALAGMLWHFADRAEAPR